MKFKIGQKWRTRDNSILTVVKIHNDSRPYPVIGMFEYGNEFHDFSSFGRFGIGDEDSDGDLVELIHDPVSYISKTQHTAQDVLDFLERRFLVDRKIEFPGDVLDKTTTLVEAVLYTLDQEEIGEHYDED